MYTLNNSSSTKCRGLLKIQKYGFFRLCHALNERGLFKDSRFIIIEKHVAMFLMTIGHNYCNFLYKIFQHSGAMVSRYFYTVLHALAVISKEKVKPPSFDETYKQY